MKKVQAAEESRKYPEILTWIRQNWLSGGIPDIFKYTAIYCLEMFLEKMREAGAKWFYFSATNENTHNRFSNVKPAYLGVHSPIANLFCGTI